MEEWFYEEDGEKLGPLSRSEMKMHAKGGSIEAETRIWHPSREEWVPAYETHFVSPGSRPLSQQLAHLSWLSPLVALMINHFLNQTGIHQTQEAARVADLTRAYLSVALYLVGFAAGSAALFGVKRYGWKRILIPASIGILINGVVLVLYLRIWMG